MLTGVRIYCSDPIWRQILTDLNATVLNAPSTTDLNFDDIDIAETLSPMDLQVAILNAADSGHLLRQVFGTDVSLPRIQSQIVVALYKSGGMTATELKCALGYAPDVATHTVDTAIYQLRKLYGRGFIKNTNGVYRLGKL
ncbi:MAG: hypothetical protein ACLRFP_00100 [Alphaproteobacteria bacterium]|nr:winged helix-turn-helix domain-containing protein [Alphaproteobacteria bacterium]